MRNRFNTTKNPYQGEYKRVLCVCMAGCLRSPTAAYVLSLEPFNFNTRAAGIDKEFAIVAVDDVLLEWAEEVVCMDANQVIALKEMGCKRPIINLSIPDNFNYRDPILMRMIKDRYLDQQPRPCKHENGTWFDRTICLRKDGTEGMADICKDCGEEVPPKAA